MIQIPLEPAITEYLHRKASASRIPLSGTFELTPVCNMNCRMCYVRMSHQQQQAIRPLRSAREWLSLAEEAKKHGMLYLLITGGEPFLHPEFRQILTGLQKMGFVISINSNGTLIDEQTVAWLKECPPTRINITLYGASDETYDRLCCNPRGFTQVTRAIRLLKEAGILVKLNCSITPHNAHDLEKIIAFAREEKLVVQATSYMFPPLRRDPSKIGQNDRFTPEEAAYYSAKVEALLGGKEAFLARPEEEIPPLPSETEENCDAPGDKIRCRAGKCSFWVTWEGELMPCGMIPGNRDGNVFDIGFLPAWKKAMETVDAIRLPPKCAACGIKDTCRACAAMVLTETGCYSKVPEYRCQMAYAYAAQRKKLKEELLSEEKA